MLFSANRSTRRRTVLRAAGLNEATRSASGDEGAVARGVYERGEDQCPVGRPEERVDGVLGVGHEAEDVSVRVADPRDVGDGTVRILACRVAEDNLAVRVEVREQFGRRVEAAVVVLHRDNELLSFLAPGREEGVRVLNA